MPIRLLYYCQTFRTNALYEGGPADLRRLFGNSELVFEVSSVTNVLSCGLNSKSLYSGGLSSGGITASGSICLFR